MNKLYYLPRDNDSEIGRMLVRKLVRENGFEVEFCRTDDEDYRLELEKGLGKKVPVLIVEKEIYEGLHRIKGYVESEMGPRYDEIRERCNEHLLRLSGLKNQR